MPGHDGSSLCERLLLIAVFPPPLILILWLVCCPAGEYTGAWSDSSSLWQQHPEVKAACKQGAKDDGAFWMSFEVRGRKCETGYVAVVVVCLLDYALQAGLQASCQQGRRHLLDGIRGAGARIA